MIKRIYFTTIAYLVSLLLSFKCYSQSLDIDESLVGFDDYLTSVLTEWNAPGAGVAVVYKDQLVYARGFGYRDFGEKLPVTKNTLFQIASNTKLFTVIAAGFLVEEGLLTWDEPIKKSVPQIEFYNDFLNTNVTLRDMLGHKTGISRHDMIWYQSDFTRKEVFDKIKYLEPNFPLRTKFLYNNLMYTAVGYSIELKTQKTWEKFTEENIFGPLEMNNTMFSIQEMKLQEDYGVPYSEKRDTSILYKTPLVEDGTAVGPAGSIISNLEDMSHWVIALMNDGYYKNKNVIPSGIIKETVKPGMAFSNNAMENKGYNERLNSVYGMGRFIEVYKGHILVDHGGDLPGFHSQVAILPYDSIGIICFVIGDHAYKVRDIITYNIIDRILDLEQTDWNGRWLADYKNARKAGKKARTQTGFDQVEGTLPTHGLDHYIGIYSDETYGEFEIAQKDDSLYFTFRKFTLPLKHYHYNRFDTPNDENFGKWSVNFGITPQGEIGDALISIDEGQVIFYKQADRQLFKPEILNQYVGSYDWGGTLFKVIMKNKILFLSQPGSIDFELIPYKKDLFRVKEFNDQLVEFVIKDKNVLSLKWKDSTGIYELKKIENK